MATQEEVDVAFANYKAAVQLQKRTRTELVSLLAQSHQIYASVEDSIYIGPSVYMRTTQAYPDHETWRMVTGPNGKTHAQHYIEHGITRGLVIDPIDARAKEIEEEQKRFKAENKAKAKTQNAVRIAKGYDKRYSI